MSIFCFAGTYDAHFLAAEFRIFSRKEFKRQNLTSRRSVHFSRFLLERRTSPAVCLSRLLDNPPPSSLLTCPLILPSANFLYTLPCFPRSSASLFLFYLSTLVLVSKLFIYLLHFPLFSDFFGWILRLCPLSSTRTLRSPS